MKFTGTLIIVLACSLSMLSSFTHAREHAALSEADGKRRLWAGGNGAKGGGKKEGGGKGGSSKGGSSKGGKGGGGSKGSGGGSKGSSGGSKGSGKGGNLGICDQCPKQQCLASLSLQGFTDFPFTIIPASNGQKAGSTTVSFEQGLAGTAEYDDSLIDINATLTGSCTILSTNTTDPQPFDIDRCVLHCTYCLTYSGQFCDDSYQQGHKNRALWGDYAYEEKCCDILGFLTMTGDLILDIQLDANATISDPAAQFTDYFGQFAVTGTAYDLTGAVNGGIALFEFQNPNSFKIDAKVPFNDQCACEVSDSAFNYLYG